MLLIQHKGLSDQVKVRAWPLLGVVKEKVFKYEGEDNQRHQERSRPTLASRIDRVTREEKKGARERGKLIKRDPRAEPRAYGQMAEEREVGEGKGSSGTGEV